MYVNFDDVTKSAILFSRVTCPSNFVDFLSILYHTGSYTQNTAITSSNIWSRSLHLIYQNRPLIHTSTVMALLNECKSVLTSIRCQPPLLRLYTSVTHLVRSKLPIITYKCQTYHSYVSCSSVHVRRLKLHVIAIYSVLVQ